MDTEQVRAIARAAVERLAEDRGPNATFPFDMIWQYADQNNPVPSLKKPGCSNVLTKEGYLEPTGRTTTAVSKRRAGSPMSEYRLGPRFRPASSAATPDEEAALKVVDALRNMEAAMAARGFVITAAELSNFYLALVSSPLIILAGISGTGKSKLPRLFAELTNAEFYSIPVKPQWADNSDLFGYTPSLNPDQYIEGRFTGAALAAAATPSNLFLVLLDEMNLAAVEHYFSDFLSVIETRRKQGGIVTTDPLPLELPPTKTPDPHEHLRGLRLPQNMRVVGTANMDETTHSFSPKVLDRAFSIEFDDPDLTTFAPALRTSYNPVILPLLVERLLDPALPISVDEVYASSSSLFEGIAALLEEVKDILRPAGISFGYRQQFPERLKSQYS